MTTDTRELSMGTLGFADEGPRRWADTLLLDLKNEFTAHAAREEQRDKHYAEAIEAFRGELKEVKVELATIKTLIEQSRGGIKLAEVLWPLVRGVAAWLIATGISAATVIYTLKSHTPE